MGLVHKIKEENRLRSFIDKEFAEIKDLKWKHQLKQQNPNLSMYSDIHQLIHINSLESLTEAEKLIVSKNDYLIYNYLIKDENQILKPIGTIRVENITFKTYLQKQ